MITIIHLKFLYFTYFFTIIKLILFLFYFAAERGNEFFRFRIFEGFRKKNEI